MWKFCWIIAELMHVDEALWVSYSYLWNGKKLSIALHIEFQLKFKFICIVNSFISNIVSRKSAAGGKNCWFFCLDCNAMENFPAFSSRIFAQLHVKFDMEIKFNCFTNKTFRYLLALSWIWQQGSSGGSRGLVPSPRMANSAKSIQWRAKLRHSSISI